MDSYLNVRDDVVELILNFKAGIRGLRTYEFLAWFVFVMLTIVFAVIVAVPVLAVATMHFYEYESVTFSDASTMAGENVWANIILWSLAVLMAIGALGGILRGKLKEHAE